MSEAVDIGKKVVNSTKANMAYESRQKNCRTKLGPRGK